MRLRMPHGCRSKRLYFHVSTIRAYAVTFAVLMTLTGCGGDPNQKSVTFNPNIDVFSGQPDGGGFSARTLTCTNFPRSGQPQSPAKTCSTISLNFSVLYSMLRKMGSD